MVDIKFRAKMQNLQLRKVNLNFTSEPFKVLLSNNNKKRIHNL